MTKEEVRRLVGCTPKQCDRTKQDGECFCEYAARIAPNDISQEELIDAFLKELLTGKED
jgi:uncharacterized Fe-S cluster-containing MiaB family protein